MKKLLLSILLLSLGACSNLTKNNVKEGDFKVRNGQSADKTWKETLIFKRLSWYQELTMQYDLMLASVEGASEFRNWFSPDEISQVNKCNDFKVVIAYSFDTKVLPYSYFNRQLDLADYKKIEIPEFAKKLRQHPDSSEFSLNLYTIYGICKTSNTNKPLELELPGYLRVSI